MHHHGLPRDDQFKRSTTSAVRRRACRLVRVHAGPRTLAGNPSGLSRRRAQPSALPGVPRTADVVVETDPDGRTAAIAIATLPSTPTAACAAVSSLEACPTPALRSVMVAAWPHARAGVRQPLTSADCGDRQLPGVSSANPRCITVVRGWTPRTATGRTRPQSSTSGLLIIDPSPTQPAQVLQPSPP